MWRTSSRVTPGMILPRNVSLKACPRPVACKDLSGIARAWCFTGLEREFDQCVTEHFWLLSFLTSLFFQTFVEFLRKIDRQGAHLRYSFANRSSMVRVYHQCHHR